MYSITKQFLGMLTLMMVVLLSAFSLHSQTTLATVLGRIVDTSDATVVNATVVLRNEKTNISRTQKLNSDGQYVFPNIEPGVYQIKATADGFAEYVLNGINVAVSQTVREDIHLTIGSVVMTVKVTAESPLVQTDTSSVGSVIGAEQIRHIPLEDRTSIFGLLALAPGVQASSSNARISGNSWTGTNETMDGVPNMEAENERLSDHDPSLESIGEFRVIDGSGSAKYGSGTAQVILSSKSGSNQFHGSLFGYNRNRTTAAHNYFDAPNSPKPPYDRNQFGGSLGGPIKRDKLFFFGSFEALLYHVSSTNISSQPTTAMLNGDFSNQAPIIDPNTGKQFPGNQIPKSRFSTVSTGLFPYFDTPNIVTSDPAGLGNNYIVNVPSTRRSFRYQGRGDYTLSAKDSIFVRYYYVHDISYNPGPTEKWGGVNFPINQKSLAINYTHVFSPRLNNLATFGYLYDLEVYLPQNKDINTSLLVPGLTPHYPGFGGLPSININNFSGMGENNYGGAAMPTYHASDSLTWTKGNHTLEAGFTFSRHEFYNYGNGPQQLGTFSFNGQYTGNAFADFLLGYLSGSGNSLAPVEISTRNYRYGMYVQDDWRATRKLTLNYGLRYDLPTGYTNPKGGMSNWYPELNKLVVIKGSYNPADFPGLPIVSGSSVGINTGNYINTYHRQIAPRFGFAYRPFESSKLIVRASYGLYYAATPWSFGSFEIATNPPFLPSPNYEPAAGSTPTLLFNNPFPAGNVATTSGVTITALKKDSPYPYTHMWNFTLESQLSAHTAVRATYLGSERIHSGALGAPNTPTLAPGPIQPRRPYQPFGNIVLYDNFETSSTNQLQLGVTRSFSSGLSYGVEYSWTKTLNAVPFDQSQVTNPQYPNYDRGNDPLIRRHYVVGNYVYELPFGTKKRFLSTAPAVIRTVLGNWETSGVVTIGSGLPYTVVFNSSVEGWTSSHADKIGDPNVSHPTIQRWFNPAAFTLPAPFTYGNAGANNLFGPKYVNFDLGLFKNFVIKENYRLQFRSEFFNVFNHPNFGNPDSNITDTAVGTISSASDGRVIQFALRLDF